MINLKNIFASAPPDGTYDDAARREAMAQALRERAMRQRGPAAGGPVQAQYGIGEGLTQLAEALLARRAGKSALQAKSAAETTMRQNNRSLTDALTYQAPQIDPIGDEAPTPITARHIDSVGVPTLNAAGQQLQTATAGMDPRQANQVLSQAMVSRLLPDPSVEADRELKRYQIEIAAQDRANAREQRLAELQARMEDSRLNREQRAQAAADMAALRREIAAGQRETQLSVAGMHGDTKAAVADEKKQGRLAALEATKGALARMQQTSDTLGSGGGFIEGRMPAMGSVTQDFDGAKAQLLAAIQSALRVPGIGSQSNMELQALMGALPERTQEKKVRDNQIKGIAQRLETIISRESGGASPMPPAAPTPTRPGQVPTFSSEAEAEAAGLAPGTRVIINGVSGVWN